VTLERMQNILFWLVVIAAVIVAANATYSGAPGRAALTLAGAGVLLAIRYRRVVRGAGPRGSARSLGRRSLTLSIVCGLLSIGALMLLTLDAGDRFLSSRQRFGAVLVVIAGTATAVGARRDAQAHSRAAARDVPSGDDERRRSL
jgi:hypothetical protein